MLYSPSSAALFAAAAAACLMSNNIVAVSAQECILDLTSIYSAESQVQDVTVSREYTLCSDTTFEVGDLQGDGSVVGGQFPLTLRSNAKVKCGEDGSSANNCKIDGIVGTIGILLYSGFLFNEPVTDNIVIQGVTVDSFFPSSFKPIGILPPVTILSAGGDVTFLDCVFSTIQADPMFLIDQLLFSRRRSLKGKDASTGIESQTDSTGASIDDKTNQKEPVFLLMNKSVHKTNMEAYLAKTTPTYTHTDDNHLDNRQLQAEPFTVNFNSCSFANNALPSVPVTDGGFALLRFRASDINDPGVDIVGTMNVNFFNNVFDSNTITFEGDTAKYRTVVDFYSIGQLNMESNCFIDSDVPTTVGSSTVFVTSGATVSSVNNFVSQTDELTCPFVSEYDQEYNFVKCGATVADAPACGSDSPAAAPTADVVLPSTLTTLQESGRDLTFFLRMATNSYWYEYLSASTVQLSFPITTFAPLDSAFQANAIFWNDIIDNSIWQYHLDCVVRYHLHLGRLTTSQWQFFSTVSTLGEGLISLSNDPTTSGFLANSQPLVDGGTDIATETGMIHYLADSPLIPDCLAFSIADSFGGSTLIELAGIADLVIFLTETRPLTLFAPTDDAFAKLDTATLDFLKNNPDELREVLLYHVSLGNAYISPDLEATIPTANNATFTLVGGLINGESLVVLPNQLAYDGIFHLIDTVLIPPSVMETMAPVAAPVATPTTAAPVTEAPIMSVTATPVATTMAPVTSAPVEAATGAPVTGAPVMPAPATLSPTTASPVEPTDASVTEAPVPESPTSVAMTTADSGMLGLVITIILSVFT